MRKLSFLQQYNKLVGVGIILSTPALLLVTGGVLQSVLGLTQFNDAINFDIFIFHPLILMGGLMVAVGVNLLSVTRVTFQFQNGSLVSTIKIQGKPLNLGFLAVCFFLCGTIFLYLLAENLQIFAG